MLNTQESRDGALACMDALRIIELMAENGDPKLSIEQCFQKANTACVSSILAAGDISPRAQGVLMAMAEYIYSSLECGTPNLNMWRPIASMTEEEKVENLSRYKEIFDIETSI